MGVRIQDEGGKKKEKKPSSRFHVGKFQVKCKEFGIQKPET
jgi:hypothetical protein